MKIRCYATAWGDSVRMYNQIAQRSIWPSVEKLRAEGHQVEFDLYDDAQQKENRDKSSGLCLNLIQTLEKCIKNDEYFFLLMPDTVYGEETFYNIAKYGEGQNAYVAVPHFRIDKERWPNPKLPLPNQELLKHCWRIPHQTTINANIDVINNLCETRLAMFGLGDYTLLNHYYPTIYFFKPNQSDVDCWRTGVSTGWLWYDCGFLAWATNNQRVRIIGSSDVAFMAELEETNRHNSSLTVMTRNLPTVIQGRNYCPRLFNTAYAIRARMEDLGK